MAAFPAHFLSSGDLIADRRFAWAKAREEAGDFDAAADLLDQALELAPGFASAWFALGEIRKRRGDHAGAAAAFGRALQIDPDDHHGASLHLARLNAGGNAIPEVPAAFMRALFDQYASEFDKALTEGLNYRAPQLLLVAVEAACRNGGQRMRFGSMLDLGCGTGLAGAAFRPHVDWLIGVDISPGMTAKARAKGLYDRLIFADILAHLAAERDAGALHNLIVAADVLVYFNNLAAIVAAAARVLAPGGFFAFTTETHEGAGVMLRETLRYAHDMAHARAALAGAGLRVISMDKTSTRTEKGDPVPGLVVVASHR
ncbi:MAG: tetratricopeptide repeat protein [Rhizobiales bacterium]|nr:tetratricopeptide repeat protein [Hyphomicrobiales bacterium]